MMWHHKPPCESPTGKQVSFTEHTMLELLQDVWRVQRLPR